MALSPANVPEWLTGLDSDRLGPVLEHLWDCHDRGLTPQTLTSKQTLLTRVHLELAPAGLLEVDEPDMRAWYRKLASGGRVAASTRAAYLSHLRAFYAWAQREDLRADDPTRRLISPKVPKRLPRPADPEKVAAVLEQLAGSDWLMVALAFYCGLRAMEICQVRPCDVRVRRDGVRVLHVMGKGRRERAVPIPGEVAERLDKLPQGDPAVITRFGGPFTPGGMSLALGRIMRRHDVQATGHQLRHSFGTTVYQESKGDLLATQNALGHQTPASTAIYAKADPAVMLAAMRAAWNEAS